MKKRLDSFDVIVDKGLARGLDTSKDVSPFSLQSLSTITSKEKYFDNPYRFPLEPCPAGIQAVYRERTGTKEHFFDSSFYLSGFDVLKMNLDRIKDRIDNGLIRFYSMNKREGKYEKTK